MYKHNEAHIVTLEYWREKHKQRLRENRDLTNLLALILLKTGPVALSHEQLRDNSRYIIQREDRPESKEIMFSAKHSATR